MAVQTVLGTVKASELGRTLTHEHFALDFTHFYREPPKGIQDKFDKIKLLNVGFIRQYPYSSKYNLLFDDRDATTAVLNDVIAYKKYGGGTIVENTTTGLGRNLDLMKTASEQSGVHVIAGTGYYIADLQDGSSLTLSKENMYEFMLEELIMGCKDYPSIKAGFMGEIASVWPIKEFERHAIAAAGEVQEQVKCGVSFHPHRVQEAPFEIMRIYLEAGGDAKKAVMSHLDRTLIDDAKLMEFAELGSYCQWDLFGVEVSYYQLNNQSIMPSDAQRISKIKLLVDDDKTNQVLMSHDVHTKHRLMDFGGHGYSHILNNILPVMKDRGITQDQIDTITVGNPAKWLTIDSVQ